MRLYPDAVPVIYMVEQVALYAAAVDAWLSAAEVLQVVSDLTRMECRVEPMRDGNGGLLNDDSDYFAYFEGAVAEIAALSGEGIDRATAIRAQYRFKTPDAIHLAATAISGCTVFLTNDHRLDRFPISPSRSSDPRISSTNTPLRRRARHRRMD